MRMPRDTRPLATLLADVGRYLGVLRSKKAATGADVGISRSACPPRLEGEDRSVERTLALEHFDLSFFSVSGERICFDALC